jgi:hypothetical protein
VFEGEDAALDQERERVGVVVGVRSASDLPGLNPRRFSVSLGVCDELNLLNMRVSRSKVIIALFALLAFGGQSLAAVNLPCAVMGDHLTPSNMAAQADDIGTHHAAMGDGEMAHGAIDNSAMDHSAMDDSAMAAMDTNCCDHGQCSMADCLFPGFAAVDMQSTPAVHLASMPAAEYAQSYSAADLAELYHPPLSR